MKKWIFSFLLILFTVASAQAREVTLQWDANSEPDLSHYVVYWGTSSGDYSNDSGDIGLVTTYKCTLPDDGQIYYFAVTAVDDSGLESDYSNEVSTETETIDEYLYMPPAAPKNNSRAIYQETLPDGSIAVYQGSIVEVKRPDGTIITIQQ